MHGIYCAISGNFIKYKALLSPGVGWGGGVLPKKSGSFLKPFPYLWPKFAIFPTLFMTYIWPEQKLDTPFMTWHHISYQNGGKLAKIDTLSMTKTAKKPYPLGSHKPI